MTAIVYVKSKHKQIVVVVRLNLGKKSLNWEFKIVISAIKEHLLDIYLYIPLQWIVTL